MKMLIPIIGFISSLTAAFLLWCCIRVGSLYDRESRDAEETEWLQGRDNEDS